jgi:hypothetical protein
MGVRGLLALGMLLVGGVNLATSDVLAQQPAAPAQPLIQIKQKAPKRVEAGTIVPLEIQVTNVGPVPVQGVSVNYVLAADFDLVEALPPPRRNRETLSWNLDRLEPKVTAVLRLRLAVRSSSVKPVLQSTATVSFQTTLSNQHPVAVQRPELELIVTGPETGVVGERLPLQLAITNHGATNARRVTVGSLLPPGLYHPSGRDLENDLGDLEPGQTRTISLVVSPVSAGDIRTRMRVEAQGTQPAECEVRVHVVEARLEMTVSGPRQSPLHGACQYEFTIRNNSPHEAGAVSLEVELSKGMVLRQAGSGGLYDNNARSVRWNFAGLGAGKSQTVILRCLAEECGSQPGKATLKAGLAEQRDLSWSTEVLPTTRPAAPESKASHKDGT